MSIIHGEYKALSRAALQRLYGELENSYFGEDPQERDEIEHFRQVVTGAKIFVDVGASLGQYACLANEVMISGEIFCLEADPLRFNRLTEFCRQWQAKSRNRLTPYLAAICERDGSIPFFVANANVSGGLFLRRETESVARDYAWQRIEVPCMRLDTLLAGRIPDLVKIDVEGAECRVLDGAERLIAQRKARFFVEVHPWGDSAYHKCPRDVFRFFLRKGYTFRRVGRRWLFEPGSSGILGYLYTLGFISVADLVLRHKLIRKVAKAIAGWCDGFRKGKRASISDDAETK